MKSFLIAITLLFSYQSFAYSGKCDIKPTDPLRVDTFSSLAKKVGPSVVSISTSMNYGSQLYRGNPGAPMGPGGPGSGQDPFWDFFQQFQQQQPMPERDDSYYKDPKKFMPVGTGFIIETDGLILTNFHVIENADNVYVHLPDDQTKTFEAKVIGGDKRTDVAIIKIKAGRALPALPLGDSDKVDQGEWVSAFGNPIGLEFTQTKGIISAKGRRIQELNSVPFLQTDASINPGNSGGPLVNICGEAIGINSAVAQAAQGIGFAIPIDHVKSILPQLKTAGRVLRGYVGVYVDNISPRARAVLKLSTAKGALVMGIAEEGPAAKAGIKPYDVVTKFGVTTIESAEDLIDAVKDSKIGEKVKVEAFRANKKMIMDLAVVAPPDERRQVKVEKPQHRGDVAPFSIGFKVIDYSEKVARELGVISKQRGPIVVEVESGSPASQNGLRVGDVILDVNQRQVQSAKEVISYLQKGSNILRVQNKNQVALIFLEI
jgi:serine protease Do